MSVLEQVYASGGDVIIYTLEMECDAWADSVKICNGFTDQTCTDEDAVSKTYTAAGLDISLPKRGNSGGQTLQFAIDDISGAAQALVSTALEDNQRVLLTLRIYLASDKTAPAENPLHMTVLGGQFQGSALQVVCGFFDLINCAWPRRKHTTTFAPGLKYT